MLRRSRAPEDPHAELRALLQDYELPSFPTVVATAVERITDPEVPLGTVADIVQQDPGLSAHLLRIVNSMAYAPRTPITTILQAATMLGRNALESTLITFAAKGAVDTTAPASFDLGRFWAAAARRSAIAAEIATHTDPARKSENFTAALLQDMAIPILVSAEPSYVEVLDTWRVEGGDLETLEAGRFPWTHSSVAELMCEVWEFPAALTASVAGHHQPCGPEDALVPARLTAQLPEVVGPEHLGRLAESVAEVSGVAVEVAGGWVEAGEEHGREIAAILA